MKMQVGQTIKGVIQHNNGNRCPFCAESRQRTDNSFVCGFNGTSTSNEVCTPRMYIVRSVCGNYNRRQSASNQPTPLAVDLHHILGSIEVEKRASA